ncbi:hypothetical protein J8273_1622 [Carpediemonas membranifera]|uniref:Uncharacterized protein n=1 Tax=Carpediemonas membranifera TaxID=201153 RepID=A0A8J6B0D2_9EUKA|nr:hypothetical protein J8273_1622 [Carpediemonas membranifera]|eukprot:KAG9396605.1 hypothetical protein J8273_1622 [Carpediemonas membranifera]
MATKFDVSSLPLLNSAAKEYKRELPHARFPTSFLRCLSISSQEFLRANWRPTSDYKTFEDLEDDVCPDAVIRSAIRREMKLSLPITPPSTSTPPPKQAVARLTAALEEDLFMLAEAAAAAFPEGPMAAAAQRRAEAVFTAAVAEIDHNAPVYVPLINKFNPDVPLRDDEYVAEVNAALAPPKPADDEAAATNNSDTSSDESDWDDVTDIRAYLHDEADDIVAACSVTLMPSLDVGARIKSINLPGALYGKASKHRSTIAVCRAFGAC